VSQKAENAIVELDRCARPVYRDQKEDTDFTYKEPIRDHPLVISLAGMPMCPRLVNRSGNQASADGREGECRDLFPIPAHALESSVVDVHRESHRLAEPLRFPR